MLIYPKENLVWEFLEGDLAFRWCKENDFSDVGMPSSGSETDWDILDQLSVMLFLKKKAMQMNTIDYCDFWVISESFQSTFPLHRNMHLKKFPRFARNSGVYWVFGVYWDFPNPGRHVHAVTVTWESNAHALRLGLSSVGCVGVFAGCVCGFVGCRLGTSSNLAQ